MNYEDLDFTEKVGDYQLNKKNMKKKKKSLMVSFLIVGLLIAFIVIMIYVK
jgi:predicted nucleic acid-binding Zn ribbon protein